MTCADGGQNRKTLADSPGLDDPFSVGWSLWDTEVLRWHTLLLVSVVAIIACAKSLEVPTEGRIMRDYTVYGHSRIHTQKKGIHCSYCNMKCNFWKQTILRLLSALHHPPQRHISVFCPVHIYTESCHIFTVLIKVKRYMLRYSVFPISKHANFFIILVFLE